MGSRKDIVWSIAGEASIMAMIKMAMSDGAEISAYHTRAERDTLVVRYPSAQTEIAA